MFQNCLILVESDPHLFSLCPLPAGGHQQAYMAAAGYWGPVDDV